MDDSRPLGDRQSVPPARHANKERETEMKVERIICPDDSRAFTDAIVGVMYRVTVGGGTAIAIMKLGIVDNCFGYRVLWYYPEGTLLANMSQSDADEIMVVRFASGDGIVLKED